ncbi:hypothetical protein AXG93_3309s1290 [Marchantia polymorpha subsp. ruderalis]|uniref:Uncharacterized protein n=1 Tax=Marchantia polymorpha subsp. ruderalis TaxID=1480154 RepID=A0A176W619_MARPO|nr:hypothetical protein AXG93_3309s1290 [Marchantia polymorpha subsp. ruderalis]
MSGRAGRWEGSKTLMGGSAEWQRQLDDNEAEAARADESSQSSVPETEGLSDVCVFSSCLPGAVVPTAAPPGRSLWKHEGCGALREEHKGRKRASSRDRITNVAVRPCSITSWR